MAQTKPGEAAGTESTVLPEEGVGETVAVLKSKAVPHSRRRRSPPKNKTTPRRRQPILTGQQLTFVEALVSGRSPTESALAAGYSEKTAASRASLLMRIPHVAEAISNGRAKTFRKFELRAEQVIEELSKVGFHEEITPVKVRALELLGKHLQLFVDRVDMRVDALKPEERAARAAALLETARRRLPGDSGADE